MDLSTKICNFSFNKVVFSTRSEFYLIFLSFLMFLSLTCCDVCFFVSLLIGFYVDNSDDNVVSTRQRSHTKSLFIDMIHQILNLRYSMLDLHH